MANKNSFVFYTEWLEQLKLIASYGTAEDMATLCDGIKALVEDGESSDMTPLAMAIFNPIRNQIERDTEKYNNRKKNVEKRWNDTRSEEPIQDDTNAYKPIQTDTNGCVDVDVYVDVNVDDNGDVDVNVSPNGDISTCIALPEPQFVAETDPKKMTDKMLEEEFDALWKLYPRKAGRSDALRHYKAARKQGVAYDTIEDGILRYADSVRNEDPKFIAMGSTWFCGHRWEDQYVRKKTALEKLWDL